MLGFEQADLIDRSLYQFVHVNDVPCLEQGHRILLAKGQLVSKYMRLMKKDGGSLWVQTYANLRSVSKLPHIVGVCYVIGEDLLDESRLLCDEKQVKLTNYNCKETVYSTDTAIKPVLERKRKDRDTISSQKKTQKRCKSSQYYEMPHNTTSDSDNKKTSNMVSQVRNKEHAGLIQGCGNYQDSEDANQVQYMTIGSTRRASDDSNSVISSIASTSFSSTSPTMEKSRPQQRISSNDSLYRSEVDSSTTSEIDQTINCVESFQPIWTRPTDQSSAEIPQVTYEPQDTIDSKIAEINSNQQPPWNAYGQESYPVCAQYKNRYVLDTTQVADPKVNCYPKIQLVDIGSCPLNQNTQWVSGSDSHQTHHYDVICCETSPNIEQYPTSNYQSGNLDVYPRLDYNQDINFSFRPSLGMTNAARTQ